MEADGYQKLKEVFQSAVEVSGEERARLLDDKCAGDAALRAAVDKLLASNDSEFLETPAAGNLVGSLGGKTSSSSISGQRIGHYNVERKIGSGGMGDVYLAVDGKLGRRVAIKILPEEFTADEDRLDRFQLEARAASALSHPNILTIHEIGDWEGTHYIATEYVEGQTLRHRLGSEALSVAETLEIAVQLTSAVAAAHEAGICHRDIKPENIMVRRDGIVKVVDFGLAKLNLSPFRADASISSADDPTVKIVRTEPGVIMGTVQYMSPEQTRGLPTDERSDIWSLGCVLYEMLAGTAPFVGESSADLIAEIVKTHPAPLASVNEPVPERLDEIVAKALEKNPDERYQTAKDLLIDLKRLKRRFDVDTELERSNPRITNTASDEIVISGPNIISTKKGPKDLTEVNSAEYLYWGMKAHRWTAIGITLFVIGLVGSTAMLVRYYWRETKIVAISQPTNLQIDRLSGDGKTRYAAISGDSKFLAYVKSHGGELSLWAQQVASNSKIQLVPPGVISEYQYPTFSPDGNFVYFTGVTRSSARRNIFRVPTFGGQLTQVVQNAAWPSFSPDGREFVFHTQQVVHGDLQSNLEVIDIEGRGRRRLVTTSGNRILSKPDWSPDGSVIACPISDDSEQSSSIVVFDSISGEVRQAVDGKLSQVEDVAWKPDMKTVLVVGSGSKDSPLEVHVWEVSVSTSDARQLTQGLGHYKGISLTDDGKNLVTVLNETRTAIWISPGADLKRALPITTGTGGHSDITWTKDNRIVYSSAVTGSQELWSMNPDGTGERQLTHDPEARKSNPSVSSDGEHIFYNVGDVRGMKVWRVGIDGTDPVEVTSGPFDFLRGLTSDGRWLIYATRTATGLSTLKVALSGGQPMEISKDIEGYGGISPDGRTMAGILSDESSRSPQLALISSEDGTITRRFDLTESLSKFLLRWTPDGRSVTYLDTSGNLWQQAIGGGRPEKLTDYRENGIISWEWSRDGRQLAFVRSDTAGDALSLRGF